MSEIMEITEMRSPEVIAVEIKTIENQTRQIMLANACEIGKRLQEAKELVPHGAWGDWLKENVDYSQSKANKYMQIQEKFGGLSNSDYSTNLSYSNALKLLAVPEEDLPEVIESTDAGNVTAKELEERIKSIQAEKDDAESRNQELQGKVKTLEAELSEIESAEDLSGNIEEERDAALKEKEEAETKAAKLQEKLDKLKAEQAKMIEQEKEKATSEASEAAKKDAEEQIQKLTEAVAAANKLRDDAEKRLAAASNEIMSELKISTDRMQKEFNSILDCIAELDEVQGRKIKAAMRALLQQMADKL